MLRGIIPAVRVDSQVFIVKNITFLDEVHTFVLSYHDSKYLEDGHASKRKSLR